MPDITMCSNGKNCLLRMSCYRYRAVPSKLQSYSNFYQKENECELYDPVQENDELTPMKGE